MRPKKIVPTNKLDLFRSRLDQIINPRHELVQLAGRIDWPWIDSQIAPLFAEQCRPAVPNGNTLQIQNHGSPENSIQRQRVRRFSHPTTYS